MNDNIKIYCDGAAMAYRDCAKQIEGMIARAPKEVRHLTEAMRPIADSCRRKADEVYKESERFLSEIRQ